VLTKGRCRGKPLQRDAHTAIGDGTDAFKCSQQRQPSYPLLCTAPRDERCPLAAAPANAAAGHARRAAVRLQQYGMPHPGRLRWEPRHAAKPASATPR
jgi:hypothetical protein